MSAEEKKKKTKDSQRAEIKGNTTKTTTSKASLEATDKIKSQPVKKGKSVKTTTTKAAVEVKTDDATIESSTKGKTKKQKTVKKVKSKTSQTTIQDKPSEESKTNTNLKKDSSDATSEQTADKATKNKTATKDNIHKATKKNVKSIKNTNPKIVSVGRRKTAVARVFMQKGTGGILINNKELNVFSPNGFLKYKILQPLELINAVKDFDISVNVSGGGQAAQVEAIRLGISRCLLKFDVTYRAALKDLGYLTRDPRMVERKKFGHKKARRSFQFSKR